MSSPHLPSPAPDAGQPSRKRPRSRRLDGVREQFKRASLFLRQAKDMPAGQDRFRYLIASVYFARAAIEIMLEMAKQGEVRVTREALETQIKERLPRYDLLYRVRIHDFHRFGVLPSSSLFLGGPLTLKAKGGSAMVQVTPHGLRTTCTGDSCVSRKEQEKVLQMNGENVFDEEKKLWVRLGRALDQHLEAMPKAISYLEELLE